MSDGEGFDDSTEVLSEAKRAADAGISVITVGFGTTAGSTIPVRENGTTTLKKDENGAVVVTRYSPILLGQIADVGKGRFIPATGPAADRGTAVRQVLNRLHATQRSVSSGENLGAQFQWFVLPALLLILADTFAVTRRVRRGAAMAATTAASLIFGIAGCHQGPPRDKAAIALYNAATSLIARDSLIPAIDPLTRSADTKDLETLYRARFNLGFDYLVQGLRMKKDSARKDSADAPARQRAGAVQTGFAECADRQRRQMELRARAENQAWRRRRRRGRRWWWRRKQSFSPAVTIFGQ